MSLILKVLHGNDPSPVDSDNPCTVYGDVASCTFLREPGGAFARCCIRDETKTATVPGFVEHEITVELTGWAFLMTSSGKTIQKFTPWTSGDRRNFPDARPAEMVQVGLESLGGQTGAASFLPEGWNPAPELYRKWEIPGDVGIFIGERFIGNNNGEGIHIDPGVNYSFSLRALNEAKAA